MAASVSDLAELGILISVEGGSAAVKLLRELGIAGDIAEKSLIGVGRAGQLLSQTVNILKGSAALGAIAAVMHKIVSETSEAQKAFAQLEAGVRSTGGAAGFTAAQLADMAGELQNVTRFSDEAIESAQSLLLTFTSIRGANFKRAVEDIADMAERMGGLEAASIQVGKALNDPIKGITALSRVGVSFTDAQKSTIAALVRTGDLAKAQTIILKELETEFGGSAAAARNTLGGALDNLNNQFGELFESSTRTSSALVAGINRIADALPRVNSLLGQMIEKGQKVGAFILKPFGYTPPTAPSPLNSDPSLNKALGIGGGAPGAAERQLSDAVKELLAQRQLELQKAIEINRAYGAGELAVKLLDIEYDRRNRLLQDAQKFYGDELASLNKITNAIADQARMTTVLEENKKAFAELDAMTQQYGDTIDRILGSVHALGVQLTPNATGAFSNAIGAQLKALQYTFGPAGTPKSDVAGDVRRTTNEIQAQARVIDQAVQGALQLADAFGIVSKTVSDVGRGISQALTGIGPLKNAIDNLSKTKEQGGSSGFDVVLAALPVVGGFAAAASALFGAAKAQKEAAEAAKQAYKEFQQTMAGFRASLGSPAQQALYGLSQQTAGAQSYLDAKRAGVGTLGSIYSKVLPDPTASDQRELNALIAELKKKITDDFLGSITEAYNATLGPAGEYANAIAAIEKQYRENLESAKALGLGQDVLDKIEATRVAREQQLADAMEATAKAAKEAADAIAEAARKLNETSQQSSLLRFYDATGQTELAYALRQALEIKEALEKGLDAVSIEMIKQAQGAEKAARENEKAAQAAERVRQSQIDALRTQQQAIEEQIRAQEQMIGTYRQAIDGARKYLDSSKLGSTSPLGPEARYAEARRQYLALGSAAEGGDVKAFAQLPDAIEAFRRESQNMFASGQRRADDFASTQIYLESLTSKFGGQLSIQEQMLATLNAQKAILDAQLVRLQTAGIPKDITEGIAKALPSPDASTDPVRRPEPRENPGIDPRTRRPLWADDIIGRLDRANSSLSDIGSKAFAQLDVAGRTHGVISAHLPTQTDYQRQTRDYTKATSDGVARLRPELDIGGVVH